MSFHLYAIYFERYTYNYFLLKSYHSSLEVVNLDVLLRESMYQFLVQCVDLSLLLELCRLVQLTSIKSSLFHGGSAATLVLS